MLIVVALLVVLSIVLGVVLVAIYRDVTGNGQRRLAVLTEQLRVEQQIDAATAATIARMRAAVRDRPGR